MKKQLIVAAAVATIGVATMGAGIAHAATNSSTADPRSSLVDAIASKFNLNKSDVEQVFDDQKTKIQTEREQRVKDQVSKLVSDGKITQAQADAINAKRAEIQKQREADKDSFKNMTRDERKTAINKQKSDLETWAKQNNIDSQYLRYVMGGGHGHGFGPGEPRGDKDESTNGTN